MLELWLPDTMLQITSYSAATVQPPTDLSVQNNKDTTLSLQTFRSQGWDLLVIP